MEQRSSEWLEYRSKKIGSSEVSSILGVSPYMSAYELWEIKTGKRQAKPANFAMQRGTDAEVTIKSLFEQQHTQLGKLSTPTLEYKDWPILIASLDGLSEDKKSIVEFKYPSKEVYLKSLNGEIPPHYYAQMQSQMLVSGCHDGYFVCYNGTTSLSVNRIMFDEFYAHNLLKLCKDFWTKVESDISPEKPEDWPKPLEANSILESLFQSHEALSETLKNIEEQLEEVKNQIKKRIPDKGTHFGYGHTVKWVERKGSIDYDKIEVLKGLNIETYRKKPTSFLQIKKGGIG